MVRSVNTQAQSLNMDKSYTINKSITRRNTDGTIESRKMYGSKDAGKFMLDRSIG